MSNLIKKSRRKLSPAVMLPTPGFQPHTIEGL